MEAARRQPAPPEPTPAEQRARTQLLERISGLERLFELVARHVDRTLPTGLTRINLFQFIRTIVLARVLAPGDSRLMGIALLAKFG